MRNLFFERALFPSGWADRVRLEIGADGAIAAIHTDATPDLCETRAAVGLPGMANVHSHAFQRGFAALAEIPGPAHDNFWTWREAMYRFVERMTPDDAEAVAGQLYVEMLEAGFTSVGEFHYLHHNPDGQSYDDPAEMAARIVAAADVSGIGLTLLPVQYRWSGFGKQPLQPRQRRFGCDLEGFAQLHEATSRHVRQIPHAVLGVAPHSLRAVDAASLKWVAENFPTGPIHMHIAEQTAEVADCQAHTGTTPVAWLLDRFPIDERWCLIHATHMTPTETTGLARTGAVVGLCPQTEGNLGDGIFDGVRFFEAGGRFAIGGDSHIRVDVASELRLFEYSQRLRDRRRNCLTTDGRSTGRTLYEIACRAGTAALGRKSGELATGMLADVISLDADHPLLVQKTGDALLDAWIFSGDSRLVQHVWAAGRHVVQDGRHLARGATSERFRRAIGRLLQ